ncbi:hypothetical protein CRUP_037038, partial [Coryphaenoides rupestris]
MIQVGGIKAHAAEWKANVRAEFRETRRRMSVEVHDKLQRAATIRSMERRQLGLDQRAVSLDMLSPERRAAFNSLDANGYKTPSQESIDTKLNNLRLRGAEQHQTASEDNIFNRLGSVTKLAKRNRNRELKKNIPDDTRRPRSEAFGCSTPGAEEDKRKEGEEDNEHKECNTSLSDFPLFVEAPSLTAREGRTHCCTSCSTDFLPLERALEGLTHDPSGFSVRLFNDWLLRKVYIAMATIDEALDQAAVISVRRRNDQVRKNRDILRKVIIAALYLARQEQAFRGHDESASSSNRGNIVEPLHAFAEFDTALAEHLGSSTVFS